MSGYIGTQPVPQATQTRDSFTATSGQTSFATGGYTPNFLDVYLNGVKLASADYTATNGSDVVLASGASTGDILEVVAFTTFTVGSSFTPSIDDNGNATALTIDSSENVMVGKTTAGYNVDGFEAHQNGETYVSRSGTPMAINRNSSDGTLLNFYKDGGGVGSIGSVSGVDLFVAGNRGAGQRYLLDNILPCNSAGAVNNGDIDLGTADYKYRDLFLGGGIYLGGGVAANKLDDYEEGTWTPNWVGSTSGGWTSRSSFTKGYYTKVGRVVTITIRFETTSRNSPVGNLEMTGLPFTNVANITDNNGQIHTALLLRGNTGISDGIGTFAQLNNNASHLNFYTRRTNSDFSFDIIGVGQVTGNIEGTMSFSYITTA